ncbi:hypothetical protein Tco_1443482 [Tanacetum coccineum]
MRSLQMDIDDEMFGGGWKWQDLQGLVWLDHHKTEGNSNAVSAGGGGMPIEWLIVPRYSYGSFFGGIVYSVVDLGDGKRIISEADIMIVFLQYLNPFRLICC